MEEILSLLQKIKHLLTWIIFSPRCLVCKVDTYEDNNLCAKCWSQLSFLVGKICDKCGLPLLEWEKCDCMHQKRYYSRTRSAVLYNHISEALIHDFKYNDNLSIKNALSKLMFSAGMELIHNSDIIAPIPLHKLKLRKRKFNQALMLAKDIATYSSSTFIPDLLIKIKDTASQSGLNHTSRHKNIKGAFLLPQKSKQLILNKTILLIDDVITTGATINECARVLKINGASRVFALSFARTMKLEPPHSNYPLN